MAYLPCPGDLARIVAIAPPDAYSGSAATLVGRQCRVVEVAPSCVVKGELAGLVAIVGADGQERELYFAAVRLAPPARPEPLPAVTVTTAFDAWL